jgi:hypothetical protein
MNEWRKSSVLRPLVLQFQKHLYALNYIFINGVKSIMTCRSNEQSEINKSSDTDNSQIHALEIG